MKHFKIYLTGVKPINLTGEVMSEKDGILKIKDKSGNIHRYKNYNNIEEIEERKEIDNFSDLP